MIEEDASLFERNRIEKNDKQIRKKIRWVSGILFYKIQTKIFTERHIYEMIQVLNFIWKVYPDQKIPVVIDLGKTVFSEKLIYVLLENICYYMLYVRKQKIEILFSVEHTIWIEGIKFSPLRLLSDTRMYRKKYIDDIYMQHFRRVVPALPQLNKDEYLSRLMEDICYFLKNNGVDEKSKNELAEVLIELVGNALEHGRRECLLDVDISRLYQKDGDDASYYGLNAVVLDYSDILFFQPLKEKMQLYKNLPERYRFVSKAQEYHLQHLTDDYLEEDFYTVSSFQHQISGDARKKEAGGRGLTQLVYSLQERADNHFCYIWSGNRMMRFEHDYMYYDDNKLIGFNQEKNYLSGVPDTNLFRTTMTFFPGTAYNLNFAIRKEDIDD